MSFNVKKDKKNCTPKSNKTVEQLHDEKINYLDRLAQSIDRRKTIVNTFSIVLKSKKTDRFCKICFDYVSTNKKSCIICGSCEYISILDENILINKILEIESGKEENEYFLNSHSILLKYYNVDADDSILEPQVNFFNLKHISSSKRQDIIKEYYDINKQVYTKDKKIRQAVDYCNTCKLEIKETKEKDYVCTGCGVVSEKIIDGFSYKDFENYNSISSSFDYKRINYFTEWLNHIQAKENVNVSDKILNDIKNELLKERITDSSRITPQKIKKILKYLKEPKLYDHIPSIICTICGVKPLSMPPEVINKLKEMFTIIQEPFELLKGNRKNFFSYPYVIYKFCELLELREYLPHFQLLKSREKLIKQDILWKRIISQLISANNNSVNWKFISSC